MMEPEVESPEDFINFVRMEPVMFREIIIWLDLLNVTEARPVTYQSHSTWQQTTDTRE